MPKAECEERTWILSSLPPVYLSSSSVSPLCPSPTLPPSHSLLIHREVGPTPCLNTFKLPVVPLRCGGCPNPPPPPLPPPASTHRFHRQAAISMKSLGRNQIVETSGSFRAPMLMVSRTPSPRSDLASFWTHGLTVTRLLHQPFNSGLGGGGQSLVACGVRILLPHVDTGP